MKTYMANPAKVEKKWYVVDAEGQTLGRLASEVAKVLRGKNKPEFAERRWSRSCITPIPHMLVVSRPLL